MIFFSEKPFSLYIIVPVAKQNNIKNSIHFVVFAIGISIKKLRLIVKLLNITLQTFLTQIRVTIFFYRILIKYI